jgi:sugar/nucleoside kinase (ribokinase family)
MQIDVVGLGVSTIDILSLVDHLPVGEEVQRAIDMTVQGGGPVATAIVTLVRLGASTAMIDAIGDDWRGARIIDELRKEGVSVDHLKVSKNRTSSTACILVTKDSGARSIVYSPGNAPEFTPGDVPDSVITSAKILHVNGRHWDACLKAVRIAREAGVQVSFDGGAHRYRPEMDELVPLTDICVVARDFAEKYTQETEFPKAAESILKNGPRLVVITDGTNGSWVYPRDGQSFHQPAYLFPKNVDTTGCGDSYHGAFLFGLLKGMGLEKTASLASAVAAINSQHLGSRGGLPTLVQVESFLVARGMF